MKILFGVYEGDSEFKAYESLRVSDKVTGEDTNRVERAIDNLIVSGTVDNLKAETIRASPIAIVVNSDNERVVSLDNPVYEHVEGLDVSKIDEISQLNLDKEADQTKSKGSTAQKASNTNTSGATSTNKSSKKGSKKGQARKLYQDMVQQGYRRKDILDAMMQQLGMTKAHASTYYQSFRSSEK